MKNKNICKQPEKSSIIHFHQNKIIKNNLITNYNKCNLKKDIKLRKFKITNFTVQKEKTLMEPNYFQELFLT